MTAFELRAWVQLGDPPQIRSSLHVYKEPRGMTTRQKTSLNNGAIMVVRMSVRNEGEITSASLFAGFIA
jgi:hypothetical protein